MSDKKEYDAIVVGSGAAGGWAAKELTENGLEVLLLEAGRPVDPVRDFPLPAPRDRPLLTRLAALWSGQHVQLRCAAFNAKTRNFFVSDRKNPYHTARGHRFNWFRGRQLGGRMHTWGRVALRSSNLDFKAASKDGFGKDWPIGYEDLAPYYDQVEEFLGVYGSPVDLPELPSGMYIGSRSLTPEEERFKIVVGERFAGRHVVPAPIVRHQPERVPSTLAHAQRSGKLTLVTNAVVSSVSVENDSRRATGVSYVDGRTNLTRWARGRVIVLCASTIETLRILLNSACPGHPQGLGNSSGRLGKYLMDHVVTGIAGTLATSSIEGTVDDTDPYDFAQVVGYYIPRFRNLEGQRSDFLRGYGVQGGIGRGSSTWYALAHGEMLPRKENRVTLHRTRRDHWGIPIAEIRCRLSQNELRMAADQRRAMHEMAIAAGLPIRVPPSGGLPARLAYNLFRPFLMADGKAFLPGTAVHETGGAGMGDDPTCFVLNRHNQCWDVDNVFITDGSCFVSSCSQNITLTIMALTVRACNFIVRELQAGRL